MRRFYSTWVTVLTAAITGAASSTPWTQTTAPLSSPAIRTYKTVDGSDLKLHLFGPPTRDLEPRPTIVLVHGGGWNVGSPEWAYLQARRYADKGLTTVAIQYRLADFKTTTPRHSMEDTRDAIRYLRTHAHELRVDPTKVAVYGWSAGGQLGAAAVAFDDTPQGGVSAAPDALILMSPAVTLLPTDGYVRSLLLGADPVSISPADHLKGRAVPAIIFSGDRDIVTPTSGARRFCEVVISLKGRCELHVYPGVGHLLTRQLDRRSQEMGPFDPDPATIADTFAKADAFLKSLGFF